MSGGEYAFWLIALWTVVVTTILCAGSEIYKSTHPDDKDDD